MILHLISFYVHKWLGPWIFFFFLFFCSGGCLTVVFFFPFDLITCHIPKAPTHLIFICVCVLQVLLFHLKIHEF